MIGGQQVAHPTSNLAKNKKAKQLLGFFIFNNKT